ncbi:hypothetical protein AMJ49_05930 [Parcubacteria bacterium DG_74_2]|nr:MAG: hypothetical protein AMJ49_05930 [Parcubacteria bacterium DG_74_2]
MIAYQTKIKKISGTSYSEVRKEALVLFKQIKQKTKRRPYVRSAYFNKQKVFFHYFWQHLNQKKPKERFKRLKYFAAALEVIRYSRNRPIFKQNPNRKTEILYRFAGLTKEKDFFLIQIKEDRKNKKKYFMSCFPWKIKNPPPKWSI